MLLRILSVTALAACLSSCVTRDGQPVSRNQKVYKNHPIAVRIFSKYIDEDSPMDYTVHFRNAGRQVLSFDYTVSDQPNVPHVDRDGPDSGFVANLYPGAVVEVPNPKKIKRVWVTIGTVTYGRKTTAELDAVYRTTATLAAEQGPATPLQ
jgi:hypothetical protein